MTSDPAIRRQLICSLLCWLFASIAVAGPVEQGSRVVKLPDDCDVAVRPVKLRATARQLLAPQPGIQWGGQLGGESTLEEDEGFIAVFHNEGTGLSAAEFEYVAKHPRLIGIEFNQCDVEKYDLATIGRDRPLRLLKAWTPQCKDNSKWRALAEANIDAISLFNCEFLDDKLLDSWSSIRGLECVRIFQGWVVVAGAPEPRPAGIAASTLSSLPKFQSLTDFWVDARSLPAEGFANIWRCKSLIDLWLGVALADDMSLKGIGSLTALKNLTISGTAITGSFLVELQKNACLERLELSRNMNVDGAALSLLGTFPKLETVNFRSSPGITGEQLAFLSKCTKLRHLALADCEKLSPNSLKWLLDLTELRTLILDDNAQLAPRVLELAMRNTHLQTLSLAGCDWVTNEQLDDFLEFPELGFLNVVGSKITGNRLGALAALKGLKELWVDNSYVNDEDVGNFRKAVAPREVRVVLLPR